MTREHSIIAETTFSELRMLRRQNSTPKITYFFTPVIDPWPDLLKLASIRVLAYSKAFLRNTMIKSSGSWTPAAGGKFVICVRSSFLTELEYPLSSRPNLKSRNSSCCSIAREQFSSSGCQHHLPDVSGRLESRSQTSFVSTWSSWVNGTTKILLVLNLSF